MEESEYELAHFGFTVKQLSLESKLKRCLSRTALFISLSCYGKREGRLR